MAKEEAQRRRQFRAGHGVQNMNRLLWNFNFNHDEHHDIVFCFAFDVLYAWQSRFNDNQDTNLHDLNLSKS